MEQKARSITVGSDTPWGVADHAKIYDNGIVWVATPSHGGFYVPPHLNQKIPATWRAASWNKAGEAGWYEEDCDWCLVAINFPEVAGDERQRQAARDTFDSFFPKLKEPR